MENARYAWRRPRDRSRIKVFFREKERLVSAIVTPLLWIIAFGAGLGATVSFGGTNYQTFVYPGIVAMSVLFGSIFYGIYIIWDRKLDFLKEVLVAPVPRSAVFIGKMLGGMTDVVIQVVALLIIGLILGMPITLASGAATLFFSMVLSACLVSLGLIIGANMKSPDGFNLVLSFVMWPMFFFSGALFPVSNLASWLTTITYINPLTYGVDALRGICEGIPGGEGRVIANGLAARDVAHLHDMRLQPDHRPHRIALARDRIDAIERDARAHHVAMGGVAQENAG